MGEGCGIDTGFYRRRPTLTLAKVDGSFGFCRAISSVALKAAKNCVFVGITDLFCVAPGLPVGGAIALGTIAPGEFLKSQVDEAPALYDVCYDKLNR